MQANRCQDCWHPIFRCVCGMVRPLSLVTRRVVTAVFMHPREYGNAADSSKLLLRALPGSSLFIFGLHEDENALIRELRQRKPGEALILFPYPDSMPIRALPQFWPHSSLDCAGDVDSAAWINSNGPVGSPKNGGRHDNIGDDSTYAACDSACDVLPLSHRHHGSTHGAAPYPHHNRTLLIVVLDGTWRQARALARRLATLAPNTPRVCLAEASTSHAFSRPRPTAMRASSVEAVAQLLRELGEGEDTERSLVAAVAANTAALHP